MVLLLIEFDPTTLTPPVGRPRALFTLRDPAEANGRQGGLEAGRLRSEDEDKAGEAKRQILYVLEALWDPFWYPNPSKIDPKSSWNHQKSSSGRLFGHRRVQEVFHECPGGTWEHSGPRFGMVLGSRIHPKLMKNRHRKTIRFQDRFFNDFG